LGFEREMARQAATTRKPAGAKASSAARPAPRPAKAPKLESLSSEQQVLQLRQEQEHLIARIASLEADVARLRAKQTAVADRVAWALDSLRDVLAERN
jgi:hypothetical protein